MPDPDRTDPSGEIPTGPNEDRGAHLVFDPSAYTPHDPPMARSRGGLRALVTLIALALLAGLAYGAYETRDQWLPSTELAPPPPPTVVAEREPEPEVPRLEALTRPDLLAPADSPIILAVRAMGPSGPIADSSVVFEIEAGDAEVSPQRSLTDVRGVARTEVSLPVRTETVAVAARLAGSELMTSFRIRVLPGPVARIQGLQGEGQTAQVFELLGERVGLAVADAAGNPVPGVEVRFTTNTGIVGPRRVRSDSLGLATTEWRLGQEPGTQRLVAEVAALDTTITIRATATAAPLIEETRPRPAETHPVTVVRREFVIGGSYVCALAGGRAACRGASVADASSGTAFVALASGVSHACGLGPDGQAFCWGANDGGQLGDGTRTDRESPVAVRTELRFSSLTAGSMHTCGLAGGGVPICWGQNLNGQIGDGSRVDRLTPLTVGGGMIFTSIVAGWDHTCGLTESGNAFCWGRNSDGQLGDGSRIDRLTPTLVRAAIESSLTAGAAHTCGVGGGQVLCWGDNRFGQLGDGSTQGRAQPRPVEGLPGPPRQIAA